MTWQRTPFIILLIVATALSAAGTLYTWRNRPLPGYKVAMSIILVGTVWMLGYALELASATIPAKDFWNKIQYIGIAVIPTGWLVFTLQYTGREHILTRRVLILLSIIPLTTLLLVFSNKFHGLFWKHTALQIDDPFSILSRSHGAGYWVHTVYSYALMGLAFSLLLQAMMRARHLYRRQGSALLFAAVLPPLGNISSYLNLIPYPYIDPTPLMVALSSMILTWSLFRLRIGDIVPVARELVIENMSDGVMVLDGQNRIVDLNAAAQRMTGYNASEMIGKTVTQAIPEWSQAATWIHKATTPDGQRLILTQLQEQRIYDLRLSPLVDWRNHVVSRVVVLRDITTQVRAEEHIKTSLQEKEVLLQEIHHRVKNNLQVVSSLLNLQSKSIKDPQDLKIFQDSQNRIRSMALIHEKLYRSPDLSRIDFAEYVRQLTTHLFQTYSANTGNIQWQLHIQDVFLDVDTAIPCGLILNELVSNCLEHAFPEGRAGEICVAFYPACDQQYVLEVRDNGIGLPPDLDPSATESLGLQLVNTLIHQLDGTLALEREHGTTFSITFGVTTQEREREF